MASTVFPQLMEVLAPYLDDVDKYAASDDGKVGQKARVFRLLLQLVSAGRLDDPILVSSYDHPALAAQASDWAELTRRLQLIAAGGDEPPGRAFSNQVYQSMMARCGLLLDLNVLTDPRDGPPPLPPLSPLPPPPPLPARQVVLVFGASGAIGKQLVRALVDQVRSASVENFLFPFFCRFRVSKPNFDASCAPNFWSRA